MNHSPSSLYSLVLHDSAASGYWAGVLTLNGNQSLRNIYVVTDNELARLRYVLDSGMQWLFSQFLNSKSPYDVI